MFTFIKVANNKNDIIWFWILFYKLNVNWIYGWHEKLFESIFNWVDLTLFDSLPIISDFLVKVVAIFFFDNTDKQSTLKIRLKLQDFLRHSLKVKKNNHMKLQTHVK